MDWDDLGIEGDPGTLPRWGFLGIDPNAAIAR
jgi:hypothetical protein